jgi:hypothetical protein
MTPPVKVALIICATIVVVSLVCCGGLLVLNSMPAPAPTSTPTDK